MKVFLVPHFHYDAIYSKTYEEYLEISFKNLIEAISILKNSPDFYFLIEQTVLLEEFWKRFPQHRSALKRYIENGRIELSPGMFVMPDMNLISGESLIKQIERGKLFLKKFGKEPRVCWIADCWGHHRQIPQILKKCGYLGYAFSRGMRKDITPFIHFRWKGIDGTEMLTHWMATGYDGVVFRGYTYLTEEEEEKFWGFGRNPVEFGISLIKEKLEILKKYKAVDIILLPNGGDFAKPQKIATEIVKEWNRKNPETKIEISTPTKYFQLLKDEKLPLISKDFNPLFNGTYATRIEIKQENRLFENRIYLLETLHSFFSFENSSSIAEYNGKLDELGYHILFNQFHDIICGSILDEGYYEIMEKYKNAKRIYNELKEKIISFLTVEKENSVAVFNSCSFPRKEIGVLNIRIPEDKSVDIYENGEKLPSQVLEREGSKAEVGFEISVGGFQRKNLNFLLKSNKPCSTSSPPYNFTNSFYEIKILKNGLISSLKLENGKELVDQEKPYFGELVFQRDNGDFWVYYDAPVPGGERFSNVVNDPYPEEVPLPKEAIFLHTTHPDVKIEKGGIATKVMLSGEIAFWKSMWKYEHSYFIYNNLPFIDFKTAFYPMGRNYRLRVAFPTTIEKGEIKREIPFGFEIQGEGEYPAFNWMDYSDDKKGICLINKGIPGNNVTNGIVMLSLFRAVDMGPNKAKSITGYGEGKKYCFEYRILPFVPGNRDYKPYLYGASFNQPLLVLPGLEWKNIENYIHIKPFHLPVTLLKNFKDGFLIRIYEPEGKEVTATFSMSKDKWEFYETNLNGREQEKVCEGKNCNLNFHPFEIKTLFLKKFE